MAEVRDNAAAGRYELELGQGMAVAHYYDRARSRFFTHTEVPPALRGQGIGSVLIKGALEDVRTRGLHAVPICSFVKEYIQRHPDTA